MPAAYPRSLPLEFCWGLTIGMQAADFQDSKRRLQPLRLEDRQSGARQHKESRASLFPERGPDGLWRGSDEGFWRAFNELLIW